MKETLIRAEPRAGMVPRRGDTTKFASCFTYVSSYSKEMGTVQEIAMVFWTGEETKQRPKSIRRGKMQEPTTG